MKKRTRNRRGVRYKVLLCLTIGWLMGFPVGLKAQYDTARIAEIRQQLTQLAQGRSPGLNEEVDISVTDVTIQEFLRAVASAHDLNINVAPSLDIKLVNNFTNETVLNVLVFLCKEYSLKINFTGSIMSITKYKPPPPPPEEYEPKPLKITYRPDSNFLSLDLDNDSLQRVVEKVTKLSGKNVIMSPEVANRIVSGYLQNLPFKQTLTQLAYANALGLSQTEEGIFMFHSPGEKNRQDRQVSEEEKQSKRQLLLENKDLEFAIDTVPGRQLLISFDAIQVPIEDIIKIISTKLGVRYFLYSKIQGTITASVDNMSYNEVLKYLFKGTPYTFKQNSSVYMIGERSLEGLRSTKMIQLQYRSYDEVLNIIPSDLKKGVEMKPFSDLNSIMVSGSTPQIKAITAFIREIDKLVPVIMIEVLVVDVNKRKMLSLGISAGVDKSGNTQTGGQVFPGLDYTVGSKSINALLGALSGTGVVNLGRVSPNFYVNLKALEENGVVRVRSTPKLSTMNGHTANMSIGQTDYYVEEKTNIIGTQNPQTVTTKNFKPIKADLSIDIEPIVSGDQQVILDIGVEISSFTSRVSPDAPPGSSTRQFKSSIRVKNGEMIVLGGLDEREKSNTGSGVPFLSRIPIIKWFFSQRTKSKSKSKLSVFIKPTIIN